MQKLKVLTVVGTRPEIIRLSEVLKRLDSAPSIEHILVHTGQNYDYELNEVFFNDLGLRKPDYFLEAARGDAAKTIGQIIISIDPIIQKVDPDAFLVLGDTNSCLCAIPAKKRHIPIFHMEAGNRCFDQRVPEETNRKIVDHLSDINLTYSDIAREYLLREGIAPNRIIKTGSPMFEVLKKNSEKINSSTILTQLNIEESKYFVVSAHREENINSDQFGKLVKFLNLLAERYSYPIIVSTHPRTQSMINEKEAKFHPLINLIKPLGFPDYIQLQRQSKAVISDSGTISEESSILNFPALNIRETHERPEAMEEGSVMMVGLNSDRIFQALEVLCDQGRGPEHTLFTHSDYTKPNVSEKVLRIILSYTDLINREVWYKHTV